MDVTLPPVRDRFPWRKTRSGLYAVDGIIESRRRAVPETLPFLLANKTASWRATKFHLADKVFPPARPRLVLPFGKLLGRMSSFGKIYKKGVSL